MQQVTVQQIVATAITLSNQEYSDFIDTDDNANSEIISYAKIAYEDAYSKIISANEDYFTTNYFFNVISGQEKYPLPDDFYKLRGVDLSINANNGYYVTLRPFNFADRNKYRAGYVAPIYPYGYLYRYLLQGDNIKFVPIPVQNSQIQLWYTPLPPAIQSLNQTISVLPEYSAYMQLKIACLILSKEESDNGQLNQMRIEALQQLLNTTKNRDTGMPKIVTEIENINYGALFPFGGMEY